MRCGTKFDPLDNMGRWQCRMHALPEPYRPSSDNDSIYACCGLRMQHAHKARMDFYHGLWEDSIQGCLLVDHQGPEEPKRQASDTVLFATHNQNKIGRDIPATSLTANVLSLSLAEVEAQGEIALNVNVAAPQGSQVDKNIKPILVEIIKEAYSDPWFIGLYTHKQLFDEIQGHKGYVPSRTIVWPEGMDDSVLVGMDDSTFVSFCLMHDTRFRDKLSVPVSIVRRAAKQMDPWVLTQVESYQNKK